MPVSTSLSASSLNDHSGARTGLASLTSGVIVLLTLLILAPLFSKLPKPVLAALIIEAVVMGMMDVPEMRRLFRVQRFDFSIAVVAIAGTLAFGVLAGVMIGIGLSLLWLISVATRPPMPLLARERGTQVYRELDEHPTDEQLPGVVILRLDGGLFFATSDALEDRVREVALSTPSVAGIVLDCEGIDFIDSQGSAKMGEILDLTDQAEVTLRLARVKPAVAEVLRRDGFLDRLGKARTHGNVHRAVEAQMGDMENPAGGLSGVATEATPLSLHPGLGVEDARGDGGDERFVVFGILVGIATGELDHRPVKGSARAEIRTDGDGIAGSCMSPRQRPPTHLAVDGESLRGHRFDIGRRLPIPQLAKEEVPLDAIGGEASLPTEEDVTGRLHQPLAFDHPLTMILKGALAHEALEHRGFSLFDLYEERVVVVTPEHERDPGSGSDAPDPDHLCARWTNRSFSNRRRLSPARDRR